MKKFAHSTKAFGAGVCLAGMLAVAGCNTDPTEVDPNRFDGLYLLETVHGAALPATISGSGSNRIDVTGGKIMIAGAGISYQVERTAIVNGSGSNSNLYYGGKYSFDGQYLNMVPTGTSDTIRIRYQGSVMERFDDGKEYRFRKQ